MTPRDATVVVKDVYLSRLAPVPPGKVDAEEPMLQQARVELTVSAPFDCTPAAFWVDEREGSISGSDRAVTYYVPRLAAEHCTPSAPRDYVLSLAWKRQGDTPWTIVVAPYVGETDRVAGTALFARALTGPVAARPPRTDAIEVTTWPEWLANGPVIERIAARRDGSHLSITLDLVYGNPCLAETGQWELDVASSRARDSIFFWGSLVRSGLGACGEVYQPTPVTAGYRVAIPQDVRTVSLAIPNIKTKRGLPIFQKTFR